MAGIGFKLRRMVAEDGLQGLILGYFSSAVLSGGPWLISIATLALMSRILQGDTALFSTLVVTINILSLLAAGPFQFALTRYLSDRLYAADIERHLSAFVTSWLLGVAPASALFALLLLLSPMEAAWKAQALALFGLTSTIWMLLLFLGVVRAYRTLILAFVVGNASGALAAFGLGQLAGQWGMMLGYTFGQALLLAILLWVLLVEFPIARVAWDPGVVQCLRRYPALTLGGALYYLGIWADKAYFRLGQQATVVADIPWLRSNPVYEQAAFLAQLTVLPALALFFLAVETEFFERFREFFVQLGGGASLFQIGRAKQEMLETLRRGALRLIGWQALVTLLACLLAPCWMPGPAVELGRVHMLGVYFQTLLYFSTVVFFYFELYEQSLAGIAVFALGNLLLTPWLPPGWGFVLGSLAGVAVGFGQLRRTLPEIDRLVFERQPLALTTLTELEGRPAAGGLGLVTFSASEVAGS
ncbi:exopolysaccharide Pel transporter PelG [bacterium]|nr:exopolysaccharide Pel transporter PelG [bacterium]